MEIRERIEDIVRDKKTQIPTLPVIIHNILSMAKDDRSSASDLTEFVSKDQAISSKILKLANSAYYGFIKEVATIQRAVTVIGFHEVISLTIGMGVFSSFSNKDTHGLLDMPDLWLHSIGCAFASKEIAKRLRPLFWTF